MNTASGSPFGGNRWRQVAKADRTWGSPRGDPQVRPGYAVNKEPPLPPSGGSGERRLTWTP